MKTVYRVVLITIYGERIELLDEYESMTEAQIWAFKHEKHIVGKLVAEATEKEDHESN